MDAPSGWFDSAADFLKRQLGGVGGSYTWGGGQPSQGTVFAGARPAVPPLLLYAGIILALMLLFRGGK